MTGIIGGGGSSGPWTALANSPVVTAASQASVTFSSIVGTGTSLLFHVIARSNVAAVNENLQMQLNGDTGTNYYSHKTYGAGTSVNGQVDSNAAAQFAIGDVVGNSTTPAGVGSSWIITIPGYSQAVIAKNFVAQGGQVLALSTGNLYTESGYGTWNSTAAITSVKLFLPTSFLNGSIVAGWIVT